MKKLVFSLAVLFSVALVSCGGGNKAAEAVDTDTVVAVEVAEVADSNDTTVAVEVAEAAVETPADSAK